MMQCSKVGCVLGAWLPLVTGGCTEDTTACLVGSDCPSGACGADGVCLPTMDGSSEGSSSTAASPSATGSGPGTTAGMSGSGTTTPTTNTSGSSSTSSEDETGPSEADCMPPNGDGIIEHSELFFTPGLQANYLAARDVTFDTAGTVEGDGRRWDFSVEFPADYTSSSEFLEVDGQWFESAFPGASYAARLTEADDLLGVFEVTDAAVSLLGVVSPTDGATRTELTYEPPATVLSFPLFEGQSWQSESTVSGVALGIPTFYSERFENDVDASGTVVTAFGNFQALRLGVVLTRTVAAIPTTFRTFSFVSECVGTVASVRSGDNAGGPEFTQVTELRRIDP